MQKILLTICLIISGLVAFGQYELEGIVLNNAQQPLPYAKCVLNNGTAVTISQNNGTFLFTDVKSGTATIKVSYTGYQDAEVLVDMSDNSFVTISMIPSTSVTDEVLIASTRANTQSGTTFKTLSKADIEKQNFGQDIPFLLDQTPGVVVNSDAGAGVGYTGIRVRGSDPTRVNVTINGVPLNDPESHGVFWVNLPDLASSTNSIQIQRGVGASTNGAGAFGATINLETNGLQGEPFAEVANSYGSFNTRKHTIKVGTGTLGKFAMDMRLSKIASDGWVNRASSDLQSYFFSGGYYGDKTIVKLNVFGGKERTYQSWFGTPEAVAKEDEAGISDYADRNFIFGPERDRLFDEGRQYNFYTYDNEVDNYQQDHYQLHAAHQINDQLNLTGALHYTYGRGYFEQFRGGDDFADYPSVFGINELIVGGETVESTDLIRRRWLDNHFYGATYSLNYRPSRKVDFTLGGAINRYDGDHFGEVIWAEFAPNSNIRDRYYDNKGLKDDFNMYAKGNFSIGEKLSAYVDVQYRMVNYSWGDSSLNAPGTDADQRLIQGDANYHFFNPKLGFSYRLNAGSDIYGSFAVGNREPVRNDFIDAPEGRRPEHETLYNGELGYRLRSKGFQLQANAYYMAYDNQLVPTGELNDVGSTIRQNVKNSYRAGIELDAQVAIRRNLQFAANAALSANRIREFGELVYQYDENFDFIGTTTNIFSNTVISFSPAVVGGATLSYQPVNSVDLSWIHKYVGRQYLDNTQNESRSLDPFYVSQFRANWSWNVKENSKNQVLKNINIGLQVNNLFDARYSPNGYTYNYEFDGQLIVENFLYPQAGRNVMVNVVLGF